jgi:hypothetical protein
MSIEIEFEDDFTLDLDTSELADFETETVETEEEKESQDNEEGSNNNDEGSDDTENDVDDNAPATFTLGDDNDADGNEDQDVDDDIIKNLASAFQKDGIITVNDEDVKNVKSLGDLGELIKKTIQKNEFSDLNDDAKAAIDAIRKGVPIEAVRATHNLETTLNSIKEEDFIESDTDTDEDAEQKKTLRANLIMRDLLNRNFSREKAEKLLKRSIESGDDIEDSKEAHKNLLDQVKLKKQEDLKIAEQRQAEIEKNKQALIESVDKTKEIIPGVKLTDDVKKFIKEGLTAPTGRTENGQLRTVVTDKRDEDPTGFNTKLLYYIKLGLFDKEPDFSTLKNSKVTSAVAELEKNLRNSGGNYKGGKGLSLGNSGGGSSSFDMLDDLEF